ncbi:hypothetical protein GE061_002974 [Apolygus lucorum]|uniref:Uncharacterized protein n=1 Tax=Apolygus lucorum TaxID=248454 RepID=A0A6A4J486_APOLU|nr:hypothetical protein GE061_002972 [Apolygus lucorum]KAF6202576.1 hypothetical protein GE061_002974 [Apolygus lucorum]
MRIAVFIVLFVCGALTQDEESPKGEKGEAESTTPAEDYEEEEDECEDGGLFEIFHKIMCIFKIILGLITGNSDPCCPLEIPSFIG